MSELPKGWAFGSLNDLIAADGLFSDGDWIESKDQDPNGENRLLQLADIGDGIFINKSSRFVNNEKFKLLNCTELLEGDLLIARMPDPLGRACLMPHISQRCLTVVDVALFRAGLPEISHKLLMHFINSPAVRKIIEIESSGTTRKRIARGKLSELKLPIPPAAEQARIALKLDELLAQVNPLKARIDAIPALLKRFRQSVLTAAVSGQLTEEWRSERKLPNCSEVEFGLLIKEGPQNGLYKPSSAYGAGVKIIRIDSFYSGEIKDWRRLRSLAVDQSELKNWGVKAGDILINRVNSIEYLGKCALVRCVPEPTVFESNVMRMSLRTDLVNPEYLMRCLSSEIGRKKLINKAKHAVNQASINQGDVKACKVPLPSLTEQNEIVRRVEQLFAFAEVLEDKIDSAKSRIDHLTQSILAKAFRGELMPQDPNDEPASALLESIQAQRAAAPKVKRGRKST